MEVIRIRRDHEDRMVMNGIRVTRARFLSLLCEEQQVAVCNLEEGPHQDPSILDITASRTVGNMFLLFKPPSLYAGIAT